jgi:hypothetical protein
MEIEFFAGHGHLSPMAAHVIQVDITANLEHPGPKRGFRLVGAAVFQNSEENLLGQILRYRAIPGEVEKIMKQGPVMTVEEQFEPPHISRPHVPHYLFVFHISCFR